MLHFENPHVTPPEAFHTRTAEELEEEGWQTCKQVEAHFRDTTEGLRFLRGGLRPFFDKLAIHEEERCSVLMRGSKTRRSIYYSPATISKVIMTAQASLEKIFEKRPPTYENYESVEKYRQEGWRTVQDIIQSLQGEYGRVRQHRVTSYIDRRFPLRSKEFYVPEERTVAIFWPPDIVEETLAYFRRTTTAKKMS